MKIALKSAYKSLLTDDVPVGAIILKDKKIISKGYNTIEKNISTIQHAEINAINKAIRKLNVKNLDSCDIFVTLEPCPMCAGAIVLSRIKNVFIGTLDPKSGAAVSVLNILNNKSLNHRCNIEFGILENECKGLLKNFFVKLRNKRKIDTKYE